MEQHDNHCIVRFEGELWYIAAVDHHRKLMLLMNEHGRIEMNFASVRWDDYCRAAVEIVALTKRAAARLLQTPPQ